MATTDADLVDPPTTEIGHVTTSLPTWATWIDPTEEVVALQWPLSVSTYQKMRNDGQVGALLRAIFLPIRRRRWAVDPNGARDEIVQHIASDLDLPIKGTDERPRRRRKRFSHEDHLRLALLALVFGHMFFEQAGEFDDDLAWHLSKLAVRLPSTIQKMNVATDGGLESIVQYPVGKASALGGGIGDAFNPPTIPVTRLVGYVWEREGANWTGRSMLREIYKNWLVKDRLIRIDAMKNERYGVGIPTAKAPPGSHNVAEYGKLAQSVRAGETSGVGLPNGADVGVEGIRGALPDTIGSIRYHDEAMARTFLEMFIQLGQTQTGSRALGDTFGDFFDLSLDTVCNWYADVTTQHVIEDIVDWNWGVDEQAPALVWETGNDEQLGVTELVDLIGSNALTVDDDMEKWIRDRYKLPEMTGTRPEPPAPVTIVPPAPAAEPPVAARRHVHGRAQTVDRPEAGHRERLPQEVAAATDFEAMQQVWQDQTTALVSKWGTIKASQIDAIVTQVEAAVESGDATALAALSAPVMGADTILEHMKAVAEDAVAAARAEAAAQGVTISLVNVTEFETLLLNRAQAVAALMARSLSDAASRNALLRYGVNALAPADVAAGVRAHLEDLTDTYLNDQLGGALTQAQNTGRREVMGRASATYYASELLDHNTCEVCADFDGREYASLEEAESDYPTGGNAECEGGPRCRGTLVAIYDEATASVDE